MTYHERIKPFHDLNLVVQRLKNKIVHLIIGVGATNFDLLIVPICSRRSLAHIVQVAIQRWNCLKLLK